MTAPNEALVVDVDIKESDLQRANFWFRLGKWPIRMILLIMPIVGLLVLFRLNFSVMDNPMVVTVLLVSIFIPILYPLLLWFQTKRGFANLQEFQRNVQYQFSSTGYDVKDLKSAAHMDWEAIVRAVESKHSFNLFIHKSFFHTVPKRCFKHTEDIARLRTLLKQALGNKATVS